MVRWTRSDYPSFRRTSRPVNWLEVGCPHCPNVVTFPLSAAGRTVRCPECEKTYLVPTPSAADAPQPAKSSVPPSKFAAEASDAALEPTVAMTESPVQELIPPSQSATKAPDSPPSPPPAPSPTPALSPPARVAAESVEPQPADDSPLPELPILDPPRAIGESAPRRQPPVHEPTSSLAAPPVPLGPQALAPHETSDEAQARMYRAELRGRVNLAIFVIGTIVMIAFAYIVIYISRRR